MRLIRTPPRGLLPNTMYPSEPLDDSQQEARLHHYTFAHYVLPNIFRSGNPLLGLLTSNRGKAALHSMWAWASEQCDPAHRLSAQGLELTLYRLHHEHLAAVISLPEAQYVPESCFMAITASPRVRLLTLEIAESNGDARQAYMLGEWDLDGAHAVHRRILCGTLVSFLDAICDELDLSHGAERVEPEELLPRDPEISPEGAPLPWLVDDKAAQSADIERGADAALERGDFAEAERGYRALLALWMAAAGPRVAYATAWHAGVIAALVRLEQLEEAERVCRSWLTLCRRYRPPGDVEADLALRWLAAILARQDRQTEYMEVQSYRAEIRLACHGTDYSAVESSP